MIDMEEVEDFIEEKFGALVSLSYIKYINGIKVNEIIVPKEMRGQGAGTKTFEYLTRLADKIGAMMVLSPSKDLGATSIGRLRKFYRRFGFVPNKGRNKDFRTMETMLRLPKK
jgi:GNAT superfamily N-acetyltransferase